jgi:hypothetical protein
MSIHEEHCDLVKVMLQLVQHYSSLQQCYEPIAESTHPLAVVFRKGSNIPISGPDLFKWSNGRRKKEVEHCGKGWERITSRTLCWEILSFLAYDTG